MGAFSKVKAALGLEKYKSKEPSSRPEQTPVGPKLDNPVELGHVHFLRNLKAGYEEARTTGKPIFLLFQEIPGCSTCTSFGREILQNEAMVQAISNAFVPVAINNRCLVGSDARTCSKFKEPKLNNPVVRLIDAKGKDLVPRREGIYSSSQLLPRMEKALKKSNRQDLLHHLP